MRINEKNNAKCQNRQRNNRIVQFKMTKRPDIMSTSDDAAASKRQEKKKEE